MFTIADSTLRIIDLQFKLKLDLNLSNGILKFTEIILLT